MRVVGVVDLLGGRAVHAYAGRRQDYQPVGDAVELARSYVDRYRLTELYVADLDAIAGVVQDARPAPHVIHQIAGIGVPFFLDAAISSVDHARDAIALGAAHVVVGLETLRSFDALREICGVVDPERVAFSLDLRDGKPVVASDAIPVEAPERVAARAVEAGARSVIVIDMARVGTRSGLDMNLIGRIRRSAPTAALLVGGGVRGPEDLERLAAAGCDGALVATAIDALYPSAMR